MHQEDIHIRPTNTKTKFEWTHQKKNFFAQKFLKVLKMAFRAIFKCALKWHSKN